MAKANLEYAWIKQSDFENGAVQATIKAVLRENKDKIFQLELGNKRLVQMGVFGDNWNRMIAKYGDDDDAWIGKSIKIVTFDVQTKDGTQTRKVFEV